MEDCVLCCRGAPGDAGPQVIRGTLHRKRTEEPCTVEVIRGTLHHRGLMGNRGIEAGEGGRQTQMEQTEQKENDSGGKGMTTYKGKKE